MLRIQTRIFQLFFPLTLLFQYCFPLQPKGHPVKWISEGLSEWMEGLFHAANHRSMEFVATRLNSFKIQNQTHGGKVYQGLLTRWNLLVRVQDNLEQLQGNKQERGMCPSSIYCMCFSHISGEPTMSERGGELMAFGLVTSEFFFTCC